MTTDEPITGIRLGYQTNLPDSTPAPPPQRVAQLFTDHLDTIHSPRPALDALLDYARPGDTAVIGSMAQIAKSIADMHRAVSRITDHGIDVEFSSEQLTFDRSTPAGKVGMKLLETLAEFNHTNARTRQQAGIATAKTRGIYQGAKPRLGPDQALELKTRAANGEPKTDLAREFGICRETVYQYLRRTITTSGTAK